MFRKLTHLRYKVFSNNISKWRKFNSFYFKIDNNFLTYILNMIVAFGYYENTERYEKQNGRFPNYLSPVSFTEKMQHRKIFDHNPLFLIFCDKIAVRDYVKQRCPEILLPELYWTGDDPEAIPFKKLRPPYIIKPNNRSGRLYRVLSSADVDEQEITKLCREWLSAPPHGKYKAEWAYQKIPNQLLIEEYINVHDKSHNMIDIKFYIFNNKVELIDYSPELLDKYTKTFYDRDWRRLPFAKVGKNGEFTPTLPFAPTPSRLKEMITFAKLLADDIDHLRVDFYYIEDKIYCGELTPYHRAGVGFICREDACCNPFPPTDIDEEYGEAWELPSIGWPTKISRALWG